MFAVNRNNQAFNISKIEHMVHHKNLENVLRSGLLSHKLAHEQGLIKEDISMPEVQNLRSNKQIQVGDRVFQLHEFVPFYFNTRNPMLYRRRNIQNELVILCVDASVLNQEHTIFSDGNAANRPTKFFKGSSNLPNVPFELIFGGSWNSEDEAVKKENVRKMCAEVLVYPSVSVDLIRAIVCPNQVVYDFVVNLKARIGASVQHIEVAVQTGYFFL